MQDDSVQSMHRKISRRAMIFGGAMLAAAGTAAVRMPTPNRPRVPKKEFEALIPKLAGQWKFETVSGLVLPPIDALSDRLYDNLVTRVYSNPAGQGIMLLLAYNNRQDGVLQIHRPEICYPAGGYVLSETRPTDLSIANNRTIPSNSFSATGNDRSEQVLYWTRVGDAFPQRWSEQRLAVLRANVAQIIPDGMLARVSIAGDDMATSMPAMEEFVSALFAASPPKLKSLLFGANGRS